MQKIWFIKILEQQEGPYSFEDLKEDVRIAPDTLVWKEGFDQWKPIKDVPELKEIFKDKTPPQPLQVEESETTESPQDELALDLGKEPPYLFWILAAAIIFTYVLSRLYW